MNIKYLTPLLLSGLLLSACDKMSESNCSSEVAHKLIAKNLIETVEKKTASDRYSDTGEFIFDKAKISASLAQLQIAVESVRTTKEDPNSSKKFCSGSLKITIPTSMLSDADQGRELEHKTKISEDARELNIDNSINVFTKKDFEFSVQPTDDGKELYVESENGIWVRLLHDITWSALLKPKLEEQKAAQDRKNVQEKQEVALLKQEAEASKLEAEKLQALQEKQDADRIKQELFNKQSVTASEQSADSQVEWQAEKIQQSEPEPAKDINVDKPVEAAPKNKEQHIQKMLKDAMNNDENGIQASKQYLENQPKPPKGDKKAARKINEEALKLIQSQQYAQAAPLFAKATQIDPSDVEILNNYGFVLMKSRNLDRALLVLTNTLTMKPDRAAAWANLADVLALQGHVDLATAGYLNVYRFSGNRKKTYKILQNPQLHEDSPYVREALANAIQKITR